jgi:dTDP-4-dehydrorhamnose reductase
MKTRLLITGATGHLGSYLIREVAETQLEVIAWGNSRTATLASTRTVSVDLTDPSRVAAAFRDAQPNVVIHTAANANANKCAKDPAAAVAVNARATETLAGHCNAVGSRLVYVSTDLVFDGNRGHYSEDDPASPTSVYGRTKLDGEPTVLAGPKNAVVRVSWMFGPSLNGDKSFFVEQIEALRGGPKRTLYTDEWRTPLALQTAAQALIGIALSNVSGILHVGGPERMSRWEFGERLAAYLGTTVTGLLSSCRPSGPGEPRPRDVSLDSTRWRVSFPDQPWTTFERALTEMGVR